jgi:hypothetical protein
MSSDLSGAGKSYRRSWADMNSDDSSMGAQLPSITRRKDDAGCNSVQLSKSQNAGPSSFSLVCDDSYAPGPGNRGRESENRHDALNDALRSVNISNTKGRGPAGNDLSCFGFLLPKSEETYDGENTRSRLIAGTSSEESKLGKRLLSAVAGGQSDFSAMMGQHPDSSQPSKFRKIDEDVAMDSRQPVNSYNSNGPLAPTRKTMNEGTDKARLLNSKRLHVLGGPQPSTSSEADTEWEARFQQREKQIELGKATRGYQAYTKAVAKTKRSQADPQTPNSREMCSKRQFDGKLHKWRKGLHQYDPDVVMS